jgi:hypothetical protein
METKITGEDGKLITNKKEKEEKSGGELSYQDAV